MTLIAYPGPEGTFSQRAAQLFGEGLPCPSFDDVAERVQNRTVSRGVLALSNNHAGVVMPTLRAIRSHDVVVTELAQVRVRLCLAVHPQHQGKIESVRSHPHALAQAQNIIKARSLNALVAGTTAKAAQEVATTHQQSSVLCAPEAAELYKLKIIDENASDHDDAITTFVHLERVRRSVTSRLLVVAALGEGLTLWHPLSEGTSLVTCKSNCVLEEENILFDLGGYSEIRHGPYLSLKSLSASS